MRVARCDDVGPGQPRCTDCLSVHQSYRTPTRQTHRVGGAAQEEFFSHQLDARAQGPTGWGARVAGCRARAAGTLRHADGDAPPASLARKAKAGAWHGEGVASPQRAVSPRTHKHRHTYHAARRPATATHSATCHHALGHLFPSPRARLPSGAALGAVGQATLPPHRWDGGPGQMATEGTVAHPSTCAVLTSSWAA